MIRDALLLYSVYSAALVVAGVIAYMVWSAFQEDIDD